MPVISRLVSIALRIGELAFACVVAGIIGSYLHRWDSTNSAWPKARFIYTEVIGGLSILLSLLWLLPFAGGFVHWPVDLVLSAAWFAVFGLLVNYVGPNACGGVFHWGGIVHGGECNRWKASEAFSFLSAIFWLASTLVGIWFMRRVSGDRKVVTDGTHHRRRGFLGRARV
ncbi:MAG: hypothetical protein Q9160_006731 [Pyrenula sp. 1 TL-2023]